MTRTATRQPVGNGTEPWHGTATGYNKKGCGCGRCRAYIARRRAESYQRAPRNEEPKRIAAELIKLAERCERRAGTAFTQGFTGEAVRWQTAASYARIAAHEIGPPNG